MNKQPYSIFSVFGIELEYMIVDNTTLAIKPIADVLIEAMSGEVQNEFELDEIAVSNELALHVIELKTNGPTRELTTLADKFYDVIKKVNQALMTHQARLLSSGAHPWLNPQDGIQLWPHGDRKIYQCYDKIFGCAGHGWGNLQSTHLNLPFANDAEFKVLHQAIRLLLPIIPALTASTPILEGKYCHAVDGRLLFYGKNQIKIPHITGHVIPELVASQKEYDEIILQPMYKMIAPFDTQKILQHEWLNSRGAIARFERNAIEIRILDIQESPLADIACVAAIVAVLKHMVNDKICDGNLATEQLKNIYDATIVAGSSAIINDMDYLALFGINQPCSAKELWQMLISQVTDGLSPQFNTVIDNILTHGNLAERIMARLGKEFDHQAMAMVYQDVANCLAENRLFE